MLDLQIRKLKISINLFIIPLILIVILCNSLEYYLLTLLLISLHEAGHIAAAVFSGAGIICVRVLPIGLNAQIDDSGCSRCRRMIIYLAGPATNFLLSFVFFLLYLSHTGCTLLKSGTVINAGLALFNLLPVHPLDGGRLLLEVLTDHIGIYRADRYLRILSVFVASIIICVGFLFLKDTALNISWIVVGIYLLFCIKKTKRESAMMNMRNLLLKRTRIIRNGLIPVRQIAIVQNRRVSEALRAMDRPGYFHIVYVLDEDLKVKKILTEQEILELFTDNGPDGTFDKLLTISKL